MTAQGKPVGYLDAYEDKDFLDACYIKVKPKRLSQTETLLSPDTNYICGRRGTGKSAIILNLQANEEFRFRDEVKGFEFYQQVLQFFKSEHISSDLNIRYIFYRIWKFLILVSAMNAVISSYRDTDHVPSDISSIYEYLKKNKFFGKKPLSLWQKVVTSITTLIKKHKTNVEGVDILIGYLNELLESVEFVDAESALKKHLEIKNNRCLIVIDTIMDFFERDDLFIKCVEGLLLAVLELTTKKFSRNMEVKCCIPGEVYPHLKFNEIGKIKDHLIELIWRPKDLIRMISKRMYYSMLQNNNITITQFNEIKWDEYKNVKAEVWDKHIPKYLTNNRNISEPTHVYILRHTHHTPRELIRIVNNIMTEYQLQNYEEIDMAIRVGVHESITDAVNEVLSNNEFILPNIEKILDTSFQHGIKKILTVSDARKAIGKSKSFWKKGIDCIDTEDTIISKLLNIGFFGVVFNEESPTQSHVIKCKFTYSSPEQISFSKDTSLAIHPMFYERFNIQPISGKIVYPIRHSYDKWDEI